MRSVMRIEFTLPTIVLVMALGFPLTLKAEDTQVLPFSSPEIYNLIKPELTTPLRSNNPAQTRQRIKSSLLARQRRDYRNENDD